LASTSIMIFALMGHPCSRGRETSGP
jgi:hypothetical protein